MELSSLLSKVQNAKELDFGDIMNKSIGLFKKTWVHGFLNLLFTMMLVFPFMIVIYIPAISYGLTHESQYDPDEIPIGIILITIGLVLIVGMLFGIFTVALKAGFYSVVKKIDDGEEVTVKDHFEFFRAKYLKKVLTLFLMSTGIALLAAILCFFPVFYVIVPLSLVSMIFAFNPDFSPINVIKASFSLGNKKWLIIIGSIFISGLLAELVGLFLCGMGLFFTMSFVYLPVYVVYKEVIGFEDSGDDYEIHQIGIEEE